MRQSPKIIFIAEIRDRETMEIVLNAGETGHLVFSTLHTDSAARTINRILGMFRGDEENVARERLAGPVVLCHCLLRSAAMSGRVHGPLSLFPAFVDF